MHYLVFEPDLKELKTCERRNTGEKQERDRGGDINKRWERVGDDTIEMQKLGGSGVVASIKVELALGLKECILR